MTLTVRTTETHVIAEREGRVVGRVELLRHATHEAVLDSPTIDPGEDLALVAGALLARGVATARELGIARVWVILHTRLSYLDRLIALMPSLGFVFRWKKSVHALEPERLPESVPAPADLSWRPIQGPDDEDARALVARVLAAPVNWNDRRGDNRELLRETEAECRADGTWREGRWELALLGATPVGLVLPGWVDEPRKTAGNLYVGVAPEHRGRGLGLVLHHRGLATMKREGARRFLSSTDAANAGMRRVFERLGYRETGVQHFFEPAP